MSPVVNIAPIVSSPIDISFNEGDIGNSITWFITDTNPDTYIITQDGITVDSGSWASESEITISLDGLTEGTYTFIIIVADDEGLSASDSVDVTVSIGSAGLYGDVNNDGSVSIVDALLVAQYYVGEAVSIDEILADVNLDGFITIVDALLIAQYYVGTISELPFLG